MPFNSFVRKDRHLWVPTGLGLRHGSPNRSVADCDSQLGELAADALATPERGLRRHEPDEFADLRTEAWAAEASSRPPGPVQAPALPVPPDHRIRLNEYEVTPPLAGPQPAQPDPEDPVALLDPKPRLASECHVELMAEGEILEHQVAPADGVPGQRTGGLLAPGLRLSALRAGWRGTEQWSGERS
jgi:hypothetical protein